MIPQHELASIRRTVESSFDKTGHWYEPVKTRSGSGGTIQTYPDDPTRATPVRLAPMSKTIEAQYRDGLAGRQGWIVTAPYGTPVSVEARLQIDGRTFEVVGADSGMSYPGAVRVPVTELT